MIKMIIFDLHGTLIKRFPSDEYLEEAKGLFESHNLKFDFKKLIEEYGTVSMATQHYGFREEYLKMLDGLEAIEQEDGEMIKLLENIPYKIYLTTSTSLVNTLKSLEFANIKPTLFDGIITGNDVEIPKPHTEMYKKILLNEPSIKPQEILVIGDRLTDIIPAKELGMNGVVCDYEITKEILKWMKN